MDSQTINTQARKQTRARYHQFSRLSNNTKQSAQQAIGRTRLRCLAISDVLPLEKAKQQSLALGLRSKPRLAQPFTQGKVGFIPTLVLLVLTRRRTTWSGTFTKNNSQWLQQAGQGFSCLLNVLKN